MTPETDLRELTDLQRAVLEAFCAHIDNHDVPPTMDELARELGMNNPAQANGHMRALADKGWVRRERWARSFPWWPVAYPDGRTFLHRRDLLAVNA